VLSAHIVNSLSPSRNKCTHRTHRAHARASLVETHPGAEFSGIPSARGPILDRDWIRHLPAPPPTDDNHFPFLFHFFSFPFLRSIEGARVLGARTKRQVSLFPIFSLLFAPGRVFRPFRGNFPSCLIKRSWATCANANGASMQFSRCSMQGFAVFIENIRLNNLHRLLISRRIRIKGRHSSENCSSC